MIVWIVFGFWTDAWFWRGAPTLLFKQDFATNSNSDCADLQMFQFMPLRAGTTSELSLKPRDEGIFNNETGFSMQTLIDLQKVLTCYMVANSEQSSVPLTNVQRVYFREVAGCADFSSRVTLALRQSQAWKRPILSCATFNFECFTCGCATLDCSSL